MLTARQALDQRVRGTLAAVVALALVLAALVARGQDKPAAGKAPPGQVGGLQFIDASEITIVNVDARVTDRNGPVLGLTAADFEVHQDGRPQEVTNFAFYTPAPATATPQPTAAAAALPTPTPAVPEGPAREPVFFVVYVDSENIMPFNRNRVLNKLSDFLHERLAPTDRTMVVSYQKSMKVVQPFTSDVDEVISALVPLKRYVGGATEVNSNRKQIEEEISEDVQNSRDINRALGRIRGFAQEQRNSLQFTVRALQDLVGMLTGLPGKKAILYISDGLPMNPGLELYYEAQEQFRDPGMISQSQEFESSDLFRRLVTSATAAGVTIYTIDARGLQSEMGIEAENRQARSTTSAFIAQTNYQDSLLYMAEQTGGIAITNANDPTPGLRKIGDDLQTYYSLGYRLVPTGQDRIHRIEVKVKKHPEYRLNYRKSFIEKSLPTRIGDRVVSGLTFDLEENPLSIDLSAGDPAPASGDRWTLPIEVHVPIDKIALIPEGDHLIGFLMAYYAARDDEGKQSDLQSSEHPIKIPAAGYEGAKRQYFTISTSLLLEPGTYRISVGVRDELTNQAGFAVFRKAVFPEKR